VVEEFEPPCCDFSGVAFEPWPSWSLICFQDLPPLNSLPPNSVAPSPFGTHPRTLLLANLITPPVLLKIRMNQRAFGRNICRVKIMVILGGSSQGETLSTQAFLPKDFQTSIDWR
jgi:hypothetical protein